MRKFTYEIIFFFLSLISAGASFFISDNLYIFIGVGLISLLIYLFLVAPLYKKRGLKRKKREEAFQFINRFSVSLSSTGSSESSYSLALSNLGSIELDEIDSRLDGLTILEKLTYFEDYFKLDFYSVFVSTFTLYEDVGGDFLDIVNPLLKEINAIMEYENNYKKEGDKKLLEFISLWGLSILILVFLRFGLASLYDYLISSKAFLAIVILYFALLVISVTIFSFNLTNEKVSFPRLGK